jgi:hypothetical protein
MQELLNNQFLASLIVFLSQIAFIYLRTLNVIFTVDRRVGPAILTGMGIGLLTLVSFSIGVKSLLGGEVIPVVVFLLGGAIGTYWGIKQNQRNENKKHLK